MAPVRKVSNRGGNIIGEFPSIKMDRMVSFESLIERDYLYLLDYEPEVTLFEEQPFVIPYLDAGREHGYTPDFHIIRAGHHYVVDCKPAQKAIQKDEQIKFNAALEHCSGCGWFFGIVTDHQIRSGYRLGNIKRLKYYARHHAVTVEAKGYVYAILQKTNMPISIQQVQSQAGDYSPALILTVVLHMAFHHLVEIRVDAAPISVDSLIKLPTPGGAA